MLCTIPSSRPDVGALGTAGSLISTAYLIRHSVNVLANGVVAFCYNGPPSGGSLINQS